MGCKLADFFQKSSYNRQLKPMKSETPSTKETYQTPIFVNISWLGNKRVDLNNECVICLIHENGPCASLATELKKDIPKEQEQKLFEEFEKCARQNAKLIESRVTELENQVVNAPKSQ